MGTVNWRFSLKFYGMKKYLAFVACFCLVVCGCNSDAKVNEHMISDAEQQLTREFNADSFTQKISLVGKRYGLGSRLSYPIKVAQADSLLFILDAKSNSPVHIIDAKNRSYVKGFSSRGGGPGEIIGGFALGTSKQKLWVYDVQLSRYLGVDVDRILEPEMKLFDESLKIEQTLSCIEPNWISSESFVSLNMEADNSGRLNFFDKDGNLTSSKGILNMENSSKDPYSILLQAHQGDLAVTPDQGNIVLANLYTDRIEVFDQEANTEFVIKGPEKFDPYYEVLDGPGNSHILGMQRTSRLGYLAITATDKFIYALYSGKNIGNVESRSVFVFDRKSGQPVSNIQLDAEVTSFVVSGDDSRLYGLALGQSPDIIEYSLDLST